MVINNPFYNSYNRWSFSCRPSSFDEKDKPSVIQDDIYADGDELPSNPNRNQSAIYIESSSEEDSSSDESN